MDFGSIGQALNFFETGRVVKLLRELNVEALIRNPAFLGGMAAVAVIALFMRWRGLLVTLLSVGGFSGVGDYTLPQGNGGTNRHSDNDIATTIAAAQPGTRVDMLYGIGGTPEGVISAAALKCVGGGIQGRLWPRNDEERALLRR